MLHFVDMGEHHVACIYGQLVQQTKRTTRLRNMYGGHFQALGMGTFSLLGQ